MTHFITQHTDKKPHECLYPGCSIRFADPAARTRHQKRDHDNFSTRKPRQCKEKSTSRTPKRAVATNIGEQATSQVVAAKLTAPTQTPAPRMPKPTPITYLPLPYTSSTPVPCLPGSNASTSATNNTTATFYPYSAPTYMYNCPPSTVMHSTSSLVSSLNNADRAWSHSPTPRVSTGHLSDGIGQGLTPLLKYLPRPDSGSDWSYSSSSKLGLNALGIFLSEDFSDSDSSSFVLLTPPTNHVEVHSPALQVQVLQPTDANPELHDPPGVPLDRCQERPNPLNALIEDLFGGVVPSLGSGK